MRKKDLRRAVKKCGGDVEWFFQDHLDGKFTEKEFTSGMGMMGYDANAAIEWVREWLEGARQIRAFVEEKGGVDGAARYGAATAKRAQFKFVRGGKQDENEVEDI